jgi:hypothetical protein
MVRLSPGGELVVVQLLTMASHVGLGGFNGSLVVDMKNMGAFAYNEADQTATFGPVCHLPISYIPKSSLMFLPLT